jgi:hypothetical protein
MTDTVKPAHGEVDFQAGAIDAGESPAVFDSSEVKLGSFSISFVA